MSSDEELEALQEVANGYNHNKQWIKEYAEQFDLAGLKEENGPVPTAAAVYTELFRDLYSRHPLFEILPEPMIGEMERILFLVAVMITDAV